MEKSVFAARLDHCYDELKWLYCELYHNDRGAFDYFVQMLEAQWNARKDALRAIDEKRLAEPDWYRSNKLLGMMMYPANFGGTLKGVQEKLPYLTECGINYLHLMPLLDSPKGKSDGGYAVSDFRKVRPDLGTMEDLAELADACHEKGMVLCLDFVLNHTSEEHPWAKAARAGDPVARSRYFFYDNWDIPKEFEKTVPQVFPTTAPGNFTQLPDGQIVMTSFYPFQWDLNYANPMVFNDMVENLLFLANQGMDVIRLDAVPYIWKELGTDCRNLPKVHTLVRMMRLAVQIVCPSVLLLGEVVMEPKKVAPYFGTVDKPECDMLYNVTTMCTTWHTVATRDARLLKRQMEQVCALPETCLFQNYLRCHDDIGWGLDYPWLEQFGITEVAHKKYLNDWFTGKWPGSWSKGELYNDDPRLGDARLCGTTASLTGLEKAAEEKDDALMEQSLLCFWMLHAWMFSQSGIPVLYSGDEVAQFNDNDYKADPDKADDSRYLHRGRFDWEKAALRTDLSTVQGKAFSFLRKLETIRAEHPAFRADAKVAVLDTGCDAVLGISRKYNQEELLLLFNFSEKPATCDLGDGEAVNLIFGGAEDLHHIELTGYCFRWLAR